MTGARLAILLAVTDEATAERFYQRFKWDVVEPDSAEPIWKTRAAAERRWRRRGGCWR